VKVRLAFASAIIALLIGVAAVWFYEVNRSRISFEGYQKIQEGMTQQEVEAILDGPPRWEVEAKDLRDELIFHEDRKLASEWWGRNGLITVLYDANGRVSKKFFEDLPFEAKPRSFWDWFR